MHPADEFKAEFIKKVLASCFLVQQAESCDYWVTYLAERDILQPETVKLLREYIKDKKKEIRERPLKKTCILPYAQKTAERLANAEKSMSHLKLIKPEDSTSTQAL